MCQTWKTGREFEASVRTVIERVLAAQIELPNNRLRLLDFYDDTNALPLP